MTTPLDLNYYRKLADDCGKLSSLTNLDILLAIDIVNAHCDLHGSLIAAGKGQMSKAILELCAEVERLRAATEWQPIETAPKDGKYVLVWKFPWEEPSEAQYLYLEEEGWYLNNSFKPCRPTHWTPLPAAPKDKP